MYFYRRLVVGKLGNQLILAEVLTFDIPFTAKSPELVRGTNNVPTNIVY